MELDKQFKELGNLVRDSKLEYSWKDIQEAQRTGFKECKRKVLEILAKEGGDVNFYFVKKEIEDLK